MTASIKALLFGDMATRGTDVQPVRTPDRARKPV
jgi:hypothetical protein